MKALLIGGTGATGPPIANEILERGFELAIYHRGVHEVPLPPEIEHIHGDPHFVESIERDLADRRFDLVVATYGRIRHLARFLRGRTDRFISIGGFPVMKGWMAISDPENMAHDGSVLTPGLEDDAYEAPGVDHFVDRMIETERTVMAGHAAGDYVATHFRYPYVYGPHSIVCVEWHVIKRILDRRRRYILQDGGQLFYPRCAAPNAAHGIGLAIDLPDVAAGEIYHLTDDRQLTRREWIEAVARVLDYQFDFVDIPRSIAPAGFTYVPDRGPQFHRYLSNGKIRHQLGYRDKVEPEAWIRTTVEYQLANPPPVDGKLNHLKPEDFDYEAEDGLLEVWDEMTAGVREAFGRRLHFRHPYPHPKKQGDLL